MLITDAASETKIRLDMTDPFLRLEKKISLRKDQRADYAKTITDGRFIFTLISAVVVKRNGEASHAARANGSVKQNTAPRMRFSAQMEPP
jgi:hypothetical protein